LRNNDPGKGDERAAADMPRHVAIIMDGNGRWAAGRGLPRTVGHRYGVDAVRRTVQAAIELSIPYLTIYSFSSENWSRPREEIDDLMGLMKRFIRRDLADLHRNNVRIMIIGERDQVESEMLALIDEGCELTQSNTGVTLVIAFNYGARAEIAKAARALAQQAVAGEIDVAEITPERISNALDTRAIPDPDLLIRTGGEVRLSNFLLWQAAYSELVFMDTHWPDFGREALDQAIAMFRSRDRRFGGLTKRVKPSEALDAG
jgi:undecaprenyl diphosphate synthase